MKFGVIFYSQRNSGALRTRMALSRFSYFVVLVVAVVFSISSTAYAADVSYFDSGGGLQSLPSWFVNEASDYDDSLFPGSDITPLSSDNNVIVSYDAADPGITKPRHILGGLSELEDVSRNKIVLIDGNIRENVYGGYSYDGNSTYNTVDIQGGQVDRYVYGGKSYNGNATNNIVTISGGHISGYIWAWTREAVWGGRSEYGDALNNTVVISGGIINGYAYGGYSHDGNATGNTVDISDGYVQDGGAYGGYTENGDVSDNTVTVSGGTLDYEVYGGFTYEGDATNNTVDISSGGFIGSSIYGGFTNEGDAMYNSVIVDGVENNNIIYGGLAYNSNYDDDQGKASHNTVTIKNSTASGGVYGGLGQNGANYNTVTISDSYVSLVYGGWTMYESASYNSVDINGGTVYGGIQGGFCASGFATYNTVTISGNVDLTNAEISGGQNYGSGDPFTGNTLNFKSSGVTAQAVRSFQYYNFYLPQGTAANDTMLTLTSDTVDLSKSTVEVFLQGDTTLQTGDRVALFEGPSNFAAPPLNNSSTALLGAFINYDFDIYTEDNYLWAELVSGRAAEQSNILTDGRLAPLTFLNQGADLVASIEYLEVSGDRRFNTFALMGGGSSTYDLGLGTDIDVDGFSMLAGVMWDVPVDKNSLIMSAFFEAGWGSYDTKRYFSGSNAIRGSGDTDYYGGGLHMRYKWNNDAPGGLYAEASLRVGHATSDYHTNDLAVSDLRYDSGSTYYGAHLGLGYVLHLNDKTRLEATSKFLWTHLDSDEVTTSAGDQISFDSVNSHRWRTGFRLYHDLGSANALTLYYGAAYEYEFSGDADAKVRGYSTNGSSLSGNSGVGELGVIFRPSKDNDRMLMRLGVQGYVGAREGISGILKLQYAF